MQKALDLALLLTQSYKKLAIILVSIIYDLNEVKVPLDSKLSFIKDKNLLYLKTIDKICITYIKNKIV